MAVVPTYITLCILALADACNRVSGARLRMWFAGGAIIRARLGPRRGRIVRHLVAQLQLLLLHVGEDLRREFGRASRIVDLGDSAILVDERGDPPRLGGAPVVRRAVRHGNSQVCIAEQRKIEMVVSGELGVGRDGVVAAAEDGHVFLGELTAQGLEGAALCGSSGRRGARKEPDEKLHTLKRSAPVRERKTQ